MVYSEFPVEQLARLASSPFQIGFARQAMRTLAPSDTLAFEATQEGLLMRAQNEDALTKPIALLLGLYRDNLVLPPPRVRYLSLGDRPYEPIMLLRVRTAPRHWAVVHDDAVAFLRETSDERVLVLVARGAWPGAHLPRRLLAEGGPQTLYGDRDLEVRADRLVLPARGPAVHVWRLS